MLPLLKGCRILDLCRLIPGDYATLKLADLGADVIKIEHPDAGDYLRDLPPFVGGVGLYYLMLNRNKKSVALDYTTEEGYALFLELVRSADAVVEVSRPGARRDEGLDYESLRKVKPDLVYCSITGYGQTGPYSGFPSHGFNIDAAAGILQLEDGDSARSDSGNDEANGTLPEVDWISIDGVCPGMTGVEEGGLHAALAVTAALHYRSVTGEGQFLDISCWDGAVAAMGTAFNAAHILNVGRPFPRTSPLAPKYNVYRTADGKYLFIAPMEQWFWKRFCEVVGHPEWASEEEAGGGMLDFRANQELRHRIAETLAKQPRAYWIAEFDKAKVPMSPFDDLRDVISSEQMAARKLLVRAEGAGENGLALVGLPIKSDTGEHSLVIEPPRLGAQTEEWLESVGVDGERLRMLKEKGIIGPRTDRAEVK